MAKKITLDDYQKEMPKPFPKAKGEGTGLTTEKREAQYAKILKVGLRILKDWFEDRQDLSGFPKTKWKKDAQFQAFSEAFKPKDVGGQSERTRLWDAVKLASQEVWLQENDLGRLSNCEKWKLIGKPNDEQKSKLGQALLGIKETDERKKQKQVKKLVAALTVQDIIEALNSRQYDILDRLEQVLPVAENATGDDADALELTIDETIKWLEKRLLPRLQSIRASIGEL